MTHKTDSVIKTDVNAKCVVRETFINRLSPIIAIIY